MPTNIRMAQYGIKKSPEILISRGLGSCVGVAIYDQTIKLGGLIHIMLPHNNKNSSKITKYANTGLPFLIEQMVKKGAARNNLTAKIAGGANMFSEINKSPQLNIGERNVTAVSQILKKEKIEITGKDVGGEYGRTMKFDIENGEVTIKSKNGKKAI